MNFSPRKLDGKPVWTCGLTAPVFFFGADGGDRGEVGKIGGLAFRMLSGRPPESKIKTEKPVTLSLNIPAGTKLPPVAKVELRLCIEKNGRVSHASVIQADLLKLFDRAAVKTVAGWRFAHSSARMCDVYEWVRFPLSGG